MSDKEPRGKITIIAYSDMYHFRVEMQSKDAEFTFEDLADLVRICSDAHNDEPIEGYLQPSYRENYGDIIWAYSLHIDSESLQELKEWSGVSSYFGVVIDNKLSTPHCLKEFFSRLMQEPDVSDVCIVDMPYSMSRVLK